MYKNYRTHIARYDTLQPGFVRPEHTMVTNYRYNSLNQVVQSYQPDYDSISFVYYDLLSRPVLSQDGKQRQQDKYSYTVYDSLGRIVEVGQVVSNTPVTRKDAADTTFVRKFLENGTKCEITKTWYDKPMLSSLNFDQTHLRNRIAAVSFAPADDNNYQSATHYSYDIHGNVNSLVQDIPALGAYDRQFTVLDYEYDLISGNVNRVWYQKGKPEQYSHRYRYDADNRITHVYSSNIFKITRDNTVSQERLEARYFYLPTGALSRVELGHKQIQGIDYAYTLQGWLKDINGYKTSINDLYGYPVTCDIGSDSYYANGNLNKHFACDGYSATFQYYAGDYKPVVGPDYFNAPSGNVISLYNGNISALTSSLFHLDVTLLKLFRYDKLNRIKRMRTASRYWNDSGWDDPSDDFSTRYSYDWNGNLLSLRRKKEDGMIKHDIRYHYPTANNRLGSITATGINSSTYQYDALGNLVRDNAENLTVAWNSLGKVDSIVKNSATISSFRYSPTGQRQMKAVRGDTTFYIQDATGNVMCVYRLKNDTLTAMERYLYGSKRLGMLEQQVWIKAGGAARLQDTCTIGHRLYELTDHLGNVTTTLFDRKILIFNINEDTVYMPAVNTYTDYYPFGYPMSWRSFDMGGYRYFFNGQEADNEVLGDGASFSAEFWQYDSRLGRRWNVDPVFKEYESPYACFAGNPVWFADRFGADTVFDDDVARQDFLTALKNVTDFIKVLSNEIANLNEQLKNADITKHNRKTIEKSIKFNETLLSDWNKLKKDFDSIISSHVVFHYNSDPTGLLPYEMGKLWGDKINLEKKGNEWYGDVYITVRKSHDDFVIHENRHGNQHLENSRNRPIFCLEREAFLYQQIYDASAIEEIISAALKYFHPVISTQPEFYGLEDAIRDMYSLGR